MEKNVTEIFKVKIGLSPELMNDILEFIKKPLVPNLGIRTASDIG